ncbi:MAG: hypothetical protein V4596_11040 [Bdellovibrionota bacterium]
MKKLIIMFAVVLLSEVSQANSTILTVSRSAYPSGNISAYYPDVESSLIAEANKYCNQTARKVKNISNINIQIYGDFVLSKDSTKAISYPKVLFSAVVACK